MNDILGEIAYRLCNARVLEFPFPHIYVENIFPSDVYREMLDALPADTSYSSGKSNYKGRRFADPTKSYPFNILNAPEFVQIAMVPFRRHIQLRYGNAKPAFYTDLRLVRDCQNYSIGPHTDAAWKVLSFLFYLPPDDSLRPYGTSIYLPKDPNFRCKGGPHYPFGQFDRIFTAPFLPNSLFAFFKTDSSFHGVNPITIPCQRDVLLWNLYDSVIRNGKTPN